MEVNNEEKCTYIHDQAILALNSKAPVLRTLDDVKRHAAYQLLIIVKDLIRDCPKVTPASEATEEYNCTLNYLFENAKCFSKIMDAESDNDVKDAIENLHDGSDGGSIWAIQDYLAR